MADLLLANISPNKISLPQGQSYTERKYLSALSFNHFWVCALMRVDQFSSWIALWHCSRERGWFFHCLLRGCIGNEFSKHSLKQSHSAMRHNTDQVLEQILNGRYQQIWRLELIQSNFSNPVSSFGCPARNRSTRDLFCSLHGVPRAFGAFMVSLWSSTIDVAVLYYG